MVFGAGMAATANQPGDKRRCVYCGKAIAVHLTQCPYCREMVPERRASRRSGSNGRQQIRRGLLYMLLAAVIFYFPTGDAVPLKPPLQGVPFFANYFLPLLFPGGLGAAVFSLFLRL